MAIGDQADFVTRLQTALPLRWFPSSAPILSGLLSGLASTWVILWQNLQFVIAQTRINTATGEWLDAVSNDFFAGRLSRYSGEADGAYRARVIAELLRARGTRASVTATLQTVTGATPSLFEFNNVRDSGAWGYQAGEAGLYYGAPGAALSVQANGFGGWGSQQLAFQVTANIPQISGGPGVPVSEICVGVADVAPCCGVVWLNAFDDGQTSYLAAAQDVAGVWSIDHWGP